MECPFCGEDLKNWVDITEEVEYIPSVTKTEEKWGYIAIEFRGKQIGTISGKGIGLYENTEFWIEEPPELHRVTDVFRVAVVNRENYHPYFKIYLKRKIYEKLKAKE